MIISTCKIPVKLTVNTESRRKVQISCALTVKLCTCVRLIKSNNTNHIASNEVSGISAHIFVRILRNEFDFWKVHRFMVTSGLLQSSKVSEARRASR